jgi:hypothetical protein
VAASAAVRTIAPAVAERVQGEQPSRARALLAATVVGAAAAVAVYRLLRSVPAADDSE